MDIAVYHDLPPRGGAYRVLAAFVGAASARHRVTVYTPRAPEPAQIELGLPAGRVVRMRRPGGGRPFSARWLAMATVAGRAFARRIDSAGHDVVFCHSSEYAKAPELLPFLATPTLYYAPEIHRILYERPAGGARSFRGIAEAAARRRLRRLDRRAIRSASAVVTHSRHTAASLGAVYGVSAAIVELGVDTEAFAPGPGAGEPTVLSVGSLTPFKGHEFVVEAVASMGRERPRLVVVGDAGDGEPALRELARRRGVPIDVRVGVPHDELLDLYRSASVLVCGQHEEPFGLVVLEAMATDTPVLAVAEGGFLETVRDGQTGLLVERDPVAMGAALSRLLADRELAGSLAARARADLAERWRWEQTTAGYLRILRSLAR